jgi:hypothetical protein
MKLPKVSILIDFESYGPGFGGVSGRKPAVLGFCTERVESKHVFRSTLDLSKTPGDPPDPENIWGSPAPVGKGPVARAKKNRLWSVSLVSKFARGYYCDSCPSFCPSRRMEFRFFMTSGRGDLGLVLT